MNATHELNCLENAINGLEGMPESELRTQTLEQIQEQLERWTEGFGESAIRALALDSRVERMLGRSLAQGYITGR